MKKLGVVMMTVVLLAIMCQAALAAETYYVKTPSGGHLNVRAWRDTESEVIGKLAYGDQVQVQEIYKGWAMIYWGSYGDAYVYAPYLSRTEPGANPRAAGSTAEKKTDSGSYNPETAYDKMVPVSYCAQVTPATTASSINLRWGPSLSTPIMGVRRSGAIVRVIAEDSVWCQVFDDSTSECGFIMKKFLVNVEGVADVGG